VPVRRTALLACIGLVIGWAVAAATLFVWPPRQSPGQVNAVIVLAGGRAPRLARGLALVRRGVAPVLVISDGWSATWPEANRFCAGRRAPANVVCLHPTPYNTRGEAEAFDRLARARRWHRVLVVSSRYHVVRARMLFDRCFDGTVYADGANESFGTRAWASALETAKLVYALVVSPSC
jgi:uncharacterized SAM-binding protein YcdF (DUF218 family)